jgi:hypothetical protein
LLVSWQAEITRARKGGQGVRTTSTPLTIYQASLSRECGEESAVLAQYNAEVGEKMPADLATGAHMGGANVRQRRRV